MHVALYHVPLPHMPFFLTALLTRNPTRSKNPYQNRWLWSTANHQAKAEMIGAPSEIEIGTKNPPDDLRLFLIQQANIKCLGKIDL
jgi:hypothetical protein